MNNILLQRTDGVVNNVQNMREKSIFKLSILTLAIVKYIKKWSINKKINKNKMGYAHVHASKQRLNIVSPKNKTTEHKLL